MRVGGCLLTSKAIRGAGPPVVWKAACCATGRSGGVGRHCDYMGGAEPVVDFACSQLSWHGRYYLLVVDHAASHGSGKACKIVG